MGTSGAKENVIAIDGKNDSKFLSNSNVQPLKNNVAGGMNPSPDVDKHGARDAGLKERLAQLWGDDVGYIAKGEENANILQRLAYTWVRKYIRIAVKEELTLDGLPTAQADHRAYACGRKLSDVVLESYQRRHAWDHVVGARVSLSGDTASRGVVRWVGVPRSGRYKKVMVAVTWSVSPKVRNADDEADVSPFFSGTAHGEVLFPEETTNNSTMEEPENLIVHDTVGQLPLPKRISCARNLFAALPGTILWQFPLRIAGDVFTLTVPLLLKEYVKYLSALESTWTMGLILAFGIFLAHCLQSLVLHSFYHLSIKGGLCCRSALSTLIVEKCFIISSKALALPEMNTGRILNMLTTDVEHANEFVQFCMYLWSSPVIFCVSTFLLYSLVGWSALVTVVALPLTLLINGCIVRRSMAIQRKLVKVADARVKATNEFISGIRIVKFMAWEPRFLAAIEEERDLELSHLRRLQWCQTFIFFLNNAMPPLMIAAVFVTYHLTGNQLTPDVVFPTLMLLAIVRLPFILLPMALRSATQFAISMKRISMFLECENSVEALDDLVGYLGREDDVPPSWSDAAAVFDATEVTAHFPVKLPRIPSISDSFCSRVFGAICCFWCFGLCRPKRRAVSPLEVLQTEGNEEDDKQNSDTNNGNKKDGTVRYQLRPKKLLRDINIQIPKGKLTVVLGATGSGKSTFLAALLGNFEVTHGRVLATKNIAYVPQQPWIMNATLRDNILFFSPLDEERLNMAIRVCQLEADLNQLPAGIETEIGEKGINLSGGQKARVSLARAVYANRDFYLLDDPLSALDAHVGGRIVKDLLLDHLVDKTRVLATHQVHVLPHADFVVALDEGTVQFAGNGEEFMRSPLYTRIAAEGTHHKTGAQEEDENKHPNCGTVPRDPNEPTEGDKTGGGEKETTEAADGRLTLMEEKAIGSVSWNVYKKYIAACGGSCTAVFVVLTYLFTELLVLASNIWLSMWSTDKFKFDVALNLYVYLGIVVVGTLSVPLRYILTFSVMRRGSRTLHTVLLRSVSLGKMSFFDTTPLGRIVNRFSRDIDRLDNSLPMTFMFLLQMTLAILSAVAVYIAAQPYVLAALVPVGYVYYRLTVFYSASNREIRRVGSTAKAPLMSLVGEAVAGSDTIAAYKCQSEIMKRVLGHIDLVYAASLLENSANRWIGLRVEFLNTVVILIIALVGVFGKMFGLDSHDIALVSLSLTMALTTTAALNWFVRMCGSMEADMNSVERILHYTDNIEHEDMPELDELVEASRMTAKGKDKATEPTSAKVDVERSTTGERDGRAGWVEFRDVDLRYRDGLPLVLNKVSFRINPGQKVGIVGRTGSGKSTLLLTFMRMVDICGGEIIVSGRPIHSYGLRELRQLFSMIPQDPVLFDGTIISNIDPFNLSTTEEVWHALEQVGMREHVEVGIAGLETRVQEGGTNYSVGQRQLLCLARALLRRDSDFILMDEATANIDHTLDRQIQNTVRTAFAKHTVITIAHRLHTVAQYDTIIVMDHGVVAEHGAPRDLVANPSSKFRELLNSLGGSEIGTFMKSMEADVSSMQN